MNDIRPPKRTQPQRPSASPEVNRAQPENVTPQATPTSEPTSSQPLSIQPKRKSRRNKIIGALLAFLIVCITIAVGVGAWYYQQLRPVSDNVTASSKKVTIAPGSSVQMIAETLKDEALIRNETAFEWYLRLNKGTSLQAGNYALRSNMTVPEIVAALRSGKTETITITFLPGATVEDNQKVLQSAGFSDESITAAFSKQYDHPVFESKPISADLEGYIYGETYQFPAEVTVETILTRTFDELYKVVQQEKLVEGYKSQKLSLYQGIILASIIQREVPTPDDQKQVAQVFFSRIKEDMNLGSDVTYQYIADKTGQQRDPGLDSPYNTRRYSGLPPGPIAAPGKSALIAVANPAQGDYLFFLSGDDDKTYFARTSAEHDKNIIEHCKKKCQIL